MPRLQLDVDDSTLAALERALADIRQAGAPDDAPIRVRTRSNFHPDGGHLRTVTARWDSEHDQR